jgi:type III secretion protein J
MKGYWKRGTLLMLALILCACNNEFRSIATGVDEREANIIIVFLESREIQARKELMATGPSATFEGGVAPKFNILVDKQQAIEAMAILNSNGMPRRQGTNLLELFAKQGLMSTDKEETIRYQSGLAQQLSNMILLIDGILEASVQLSFPDQQRVGEETAEKPQITAAIFLKHQGIADDPNAHLENKVKRLVSGSISGLDIANVTVVTDKSRFTDVPAEILAKSELLGRSQEYVKIWSMIMSKESAGRFRSLFFLLLSLSLVLGASIGWILWKIYPILRTQGGIKELLNPIPLMKSFRKSKEPPAPGAP